MGIQGNDKAIVLQIEQVLGRELRERVQYNEQKRVIRLNLSNLDLSQVPSELSQLSSLGVLRLDNNQLSQVPVELGQLASLRTLRLENNQLRGLPSELGKLVSLRTLRLDNNELRAIPAELGQLAHLTRLDLNNNKLNIIPAELGQMASLEVLRLDNNQLREVPAELGQLAYLTRLDLNNNELNIIPAELGQLVSLETLQLDNNHLREIPAELSQLAHLTRLDLSNNELSTIPLELGRLSSLQTLQLDNNQLRAIPAELSQLAHLTRLDLDRNELREIPSELGQLASLQKLYLYKNQLRAVPAELGQLTSLRELSLSDNQLSQISAELGQLSSLQTLRLDNCHLRAIPSELGQLTHLVRLDLNKNELREVPAELSQLTSLQELYLYKNQLSKIPAELGKLASLQEFSLSDNQLSEVPIELCQLASLQTLWLNNNILREIPIELGQLASLQTLWLENNPSLLTPPPEIVAQGTPAMLAFLQELQHQSVKRYEAKLILVGEGGTGKSSLLRALHGKTFVADLGSTHGIEVDALSFPHPTLNNHSITLNTWDFGGQDIYRATHQFFLTRRSLYLVVWNARTEASQGKLDYWLKTIHVLAPQSPIVLVATHIDEREPDLDEQQYRKAYPQIVDILQVSSKNKTGIAHLNIVLAQHAAILPIMGQPWPQSWIEVEQALISNPNHYISADAYMQLCDAKGVHADLAQGTLGNYLHDLGRIVYFPDDPILKDMIILKPNWITKAISWVLEDEETRKANGILQHANLSRIWVQDEDGIPYASHLYPLFLRLMERFDLSYQIEPVFPEVYSTRSLIPQLLPHQAPTGLPSWSLAAKNAGQMCVVMTYRFDFTPAGIMSWMIVRAHRYTQGLHWRNGAVLHYQNHTARIEIFPMLNKMDIEVWGAQPYTFFVILKETLDLILTRFEGLQVLREVPCNCHLQTRADRPCPEVYRYEEDLIRRYDRNIRIIQCRESYEEVSVLELLYGIHSSTTPQVLLNLDIGVQELLKQMQQFKHSNTLLSQQMQQLYELNVRNFTRLWNLEMQRLKMECPNTFVLVSASRTPFHPKNWISEPFKLLLLCQNPNAPHCLPNDQGYELRQSKEWWSMLYPWIKNLVMLLKYGVPLVGAVGMVIDQVDFKDFDAQIQLMEKISEDLPAIVESDPSQVALRDGHIDEVVGPALRALYHFLNEVDPSQHWAGLQRVVTPDGNILWLCSYHAQTYLAKVLQLDVNGK